MTAESSSFESLLFDAIYASPDGYLLAYVCEAGGKKAVRDRKQEEVYAADADAV